jgi:hypothetical protein
MSFLRKLLRLPPPEDWRLVISIPDNIIATQPDIITGIKETGFLYYHLFESDRGNRKVTFSCTISDIPEKRLESRAKEFPLYQTKIYRWLMGRRDPEIPSYKDTEIEDTFNALKGKM